MSAKSGIVAGVSAAVTLALLLGLWNVEQKWQRDGELREQNRSSAHVEAESAKIPPAFQSESETLLTEADLLFDSRLQGWTKFRNRDLSFETKLKALQAKVRSQGEHEVHSAFF